MRAVGTVGLCVAVGFLAATGVCWGATHQVETVLSAVELRYEDNFDSYPPSGDGVATGEWAPGWPDPSPLDGKGYWTSGSTVINGYGGYGWFISADDWPGWQNRPAWFCRHMTNWTPIDSNWAVFHVSPGSVAQLSLSLDYFWMRYSWLDVALAGTEIAPNSSQWVDITQALGMGAADPPAVQHAQADLTPFLQAAGIVTDVYVRFRIGANGAGILWQAFIDNVKLGVTPAALDIAGRLAFREGSSGGIHIMDVPGGTPVPLPVPVPSYGCQWSPDGQWLAFEGGAPGANDIYVVRPDGSGFRNLTPYGPHWVFSPSFSPDGQQIVFNKGYGPIYTINFDGSGLVQVPLTVSGCQPRWSPVDNRIVYSDWAAGGGYHSDIFVYDLDTGTTTQITDHAAAGAEYFYGPSWSCDGTQIVMAGARAGQDYRDIWVVDADGSSPPMNLTAAWGDSSDETEPAWSPDGQYIVFSSNRAGDYDIWAMRPDGSEPQKVYGAPGVQETQPAITRPRAITVAIDLKPDTLNPRSRGRYVTAYIELSEGYDVADIDVGSVSLAVDDNETVVLAEPRPVAIGDYDSDGVADLMVKFDRSAVEALLTPGETATVYVGGLLVDGTEFLGSDTVRVLGTAVNSSMLTFLGQAAQADEASCGAGQALFDALTSSGRSRGTSGGARRVLRLLDALLRRSPEPGLSAALGQVRHAMSDLAQQGVGPSGRIGILEVQLYGQAGYVAYCFAVLGDCYDFERGAWLKLRRGLSSDFDLTEAYEALDVVEAQIGLLSEVIDDFRTLAGALSDPQRAQQLTALADEVETLLLGLADYAAAERTYVDSW